MRKHIGSNATVADNVTVILHDIRTGDERRFSSHNIALDHALFALAQWVAGVNNIGQNAVLPPTMIALGSGSGTPSSSDAGLFAPIPGATSAISYRTPNFPSSGTSTLVFQIASGVVTTQVTEALLEDVNSAGWAHTMFPTPFTPASTETITIQWELSFSA